MIHNSRRKRFRSVGKAPTRDAIQATDELEIAESYFCKFVATSVRLRLATEHPDLGDTKVQADLRQAPGHGDNQFLISVTDLDGKRLGEYEAQSFNSGLSLRKVYRAPEDANELAEALKLAEAKWPSKNDFHHCSKCWGIRVAIAIRFASDGDRLDDWIVNTGMGCGPTRVALNEINDKVHFLQSIGVDAFPVWVE
jgi:hypothetical protein